MDSDVNIAINSANSNDMEVETNEILRLSINDPMMKAVKKTTRKKKVLEDTHGCHLCEKKYKTHRLLTKHIRTHGPRPYPCTQCTLAFPVRKQLTRHIKTVHEDTKRIECEVCGKMFRWQNKLRDHMRVHTGEKPFKCEVCGKAFTAKYSLQGHMYLHSDEKPFQCVFCEYSCRDSSTLRRHHNRHMGLELVFQCQLCDKKMKSKSHLKEHIASKHLKVNTRRYVCDICGHGTTIKANLAKHISTMHDKRHKPPARRETSSAPRTFMCDVAGCGKMFKDKGTQRQHTAIHYPPKHKCTSCGRGFTRTARLNHHLKMVHGRRRCVQCDCCGERFYSKKYLVRHIRGLECGRRGDTTTTELHLDTHRDDDTARKPKPIKVQLSTEVVIKEEILSDAEFYNENDLLDIEKHEVKDDEAKMPDDLSRAKEMLERDGAIPDSMLARLFTSHVYRDAGEGHDQNRIVDIHAEELCRGDIIELLGNPDHTETKKLSNPRHTLVRVDPNIGRQKIIMNKRTKQITNNNNNNKKTLATIKSKKSNKNLDSSQVKNKKKLRLKKKKERDGDIREKKTANGLKLKFDVHQCYVCFKIFQTKADLIKHCQEHFDLCSEEMLKKCPFCDYVTKHNIVRHAKLVHKYDIKLKYGKLIDKKHCDSGSRYTIPVIGEKVKEIEVIPSVKNLNKIASMELDKANREAKDKAISRRKLVKRGEEWMVVQENVADGFEMPKFTENDLNSAGVKPDDDYASKLKKLYQYNKKNGVSILFPCDSCEKICQTMSALTLHRRRHDPDKKPFKKKVWRHKLTREEVDELDKRKIRNKVVVKNDEDPQPIVNKHKCDPKLKEFYINNIKGGDIEFWHFLKIFNKMSRENIEDFDDLERRREYGIHRINDDKKNEESAGNKAETEVKVTKTNAPKTNLTKTKLKRGGCLSSKEMKKRMELKEKLRKEILMRKMN